jgi:DedD protein
MRLPFFRDKGPADAPAAAGRPSRAKAAAGLASPEEGAAEARTRARRRLIGALVLLVIGIVGFPILFETQPRPLPVDTPILLPQGASPRAAAPQTTPTQTTPAPTSSLRPLPAPPTDAGIETVAAAVQALAPSAPTASVAAAPVHGSASSAGPAKPAQVKPAAIKPEAVKPETTKAEVARPDATKPAVAKTPPVPATPPAPAAGEDAAAGRFVVQVGAFTDADRLRAVRQKLEQQGIKTYTQDVQTTTGKSTRVRVGPFASRKEADAMASKVKASGLQANILAL